MLALDMIKLTALMGRTRGSADITIGLIDGPVATDHAGLQREHFRYIPEESKARCSLTESLACLHGTFVAGILSAKPNSNAPGICPNCTLLIRPVFSEQAAGRDGVPRATPDDLAAAISDCIDAGARVINLSLGTAEPNTRGERALEEALNRALSRGVIVVAAAGNQGTIGSSTITRHPWVLPVAAVDARGRPMHDSNLGNSIGQRGLSAPGDNITSLSSDGRTITLGGTSVATPFVTGAIALLWSEFSTASAAQIKFAATQAGAPRRSSVIPPLLNAEAAHEALRKGRQV